MKIIGTVALVLGGLLLLLYPFVLLADVMGLGGGQNGITSLTWETVTIYIFYYGTLAYPLVYIPCLILAVVMGRKEKDGLALLFSVMPLLFLLVVFGIPTVTAWLNGEFKPKPKT